MVADTKAPASCTRALTWALASVVHAIAVSAHVQGASVAKAAGVVVHRCQPRPDCLLVTAHRQRPGGAVPQRWWWCWHDGALAPRSMTTRPGLPCSSALQSIPDIRGSLITSCWMSLTPSDGTKPLVSWRASRSNGSALPKNWRIYPWLTF